MKISIIHPSYGRPDLALSTAVKWFDKAADKNRIQYLMCLSRSDPTLNQYEEKRKGLGDYNRGCNFKLGEYRFAACYLEGPGNMVKQMNHAAKLSDGELIVAISDDFDCPQGWDQLLIDGIDGRKDICIKVDDGLNNPGIDTTKLCTIPIMDRTYYERFKYIYHPAYNHFFGDEELFRVATMMGKMIQVPATFKHLHYLTGSMKKDATNVKNNKFHDQDKKTFVAREKVNFDQPLLSILIPTLYNRTQSFAALVLELKRQIVEQKATHKVEILHFPDSGEATIGAKRNTLIQEAKGLYVAFIDDDDRISEDYISLILEAIKEHPDVCSLNGIMTTNGKNPVTFRHSIQYQGWFERNGTLYRFPNHLNCIRTDIARKTYFPAIRHGEDKAFSQVLQQSGWLLKEATIPNVLYYYDYKSTK